MSRFQELSPGLHRYRDSSNVYLIARGGDAVLVEAGSGSVLDHLHEVGVQRVSDVLVTHHHRDSAGGLARLAAAGARVWVPEAERDLFDRVDRHWRAREHLNNYNNRQDRFSLLEPVPVHGLLRDYETWNGPYGIALRVLPAPGHSTGSVALVLDGSGGPNIFSGDLIAAPGQVWSLAATQWTYNGGEGLAGSVLSLLDLRDLGPTRLLPTHGEPVHDPAAAVDLTVERLTALMRLRRHNPRLLQLRAQPYEAVTPHLLSNHTSMSNSYVLRSDSGKALVIDFGYDFMFGAAAGADRASRRPWLQTIPALKRDHGIDRIDVVLPTHYHDDHVAGINLLRRVEGAQAWVPRLFADILANPGDYRLPCLWYDPIPADRLLPTGESFQWEEYTLRLHPIPGHTRYAVAVEFEVDGRRVLAAGDQFADGDGLGLNYVYENVFDREDYARSAALMRRVRPDIVLSGHWSPLAVTEDLIAELERRGDDLERLHRELQPPGSEVLVRASPYECEVAPGGTVRFEVYAENPLDTPATFTLRPVVPPGWTATPSQAALSLRPSTGGSAAFAVRAGHRAGYRQRVGFDLSVAGEPRGVIAEALVTVLTPEGR